MPSVKRSVKRTGHHEAQGGFLHEPLAVVLMPVLLNQNFSPDFNINYRLGADAPTGSYEVGRLANTGKNFWTIEPTVGFMYAGQQNGRAASVFLGANYNFENEDTHYQSGTQMHIDGTLAQHFPLWGGLAFFIARSLADAQEILPFPPTPSASTRPQCARPRVPHCFADATTPGLATARSPITRTVSAPSSCPRCPRR